jgi:CubicO group peptidase (beta-lactamase class C family)
MTDPSRRTTLKGLAMALGASALPGCATTTSSAPPIRQGDTTAALNELDTWIREQMRKHSHANLSVAVLDGEQVAWSAGFGLADPSRQLAATAHTRYRAGSISKVFTAMAAMQLAEQGRLDLDAPLSEVLPGFRLRSRFKGAGPVTPRLILQHRSGLPSDLAQGMWSDSPSEFAQLVETLQEEYMAFPPGEVHSYCNIGFTLLGAAIERITGEPFAQWMQARLLQPMGMQDSAFEIAPPAGPHAAAALDAKGKVEHEPGLRDMPAGGLNSTVVDLLQLARLWFAQGEIDDRSILSPASIAAMQTPPHAPQLSDFASMGLSWFLLDEELDGVGPLLWHAGGTPHHRAELMLLPELRVAVAVMSSAQSTGEMANETALKALTLMATARTGADPVRALRQGKDPSHSPAAMAAYAGHYDTPVGVVRIDSDKRPASAEAMGKRFQLVQNPEGYTRLQYRLFGLFPLNLGTLGEMAFTRHDTADGQAWLLARRKGRFTLIGTRLEPVPIPPAWRQRLGTYRYVGTDPFLAAQFKAVRLIEDAGLLLAEVEAGPESTRLALAPAGDTEAIVRGLGRGRGDTIRAHQEGADTVLTTNGMRFVRQVGA